MPTDIEHKAKILDSAQQRIQTNKMVSKHRFEMVLPYAVIGVLAHLVEQAQVHLDKLPKTKLWDFIAFKDSSTPTFSKWLGYTTAICYAILGTWNIVSVWKSEDELRNLKSNVINGNVHNIVTNDMYAITASLSKEIPITSNPKNKILAGNVSNERILTPSSVSKG